MTPSELAEIRAILLSRNITATDEEIVKYYQSLTREQQETQLPSPLPETEPSEKVPLYRIDYPDTALVSRGLADRLAEEPGGMWTDKPDVAMNPNTPLGKMGEPTSVTENVLDFIGSGAWQAVDTITFGLAGLGFKAAAPETYKHMEEELRDTLGGKIGGGIGMAAGFLLPMGWASRAAKVATGAVTRGGAKLGIKGFGEAAEQTTRGLQKLAGESLAANAGMKKVKATKIVKNLTDDIVGYTPTGNTLRRRVWGRLKGTAPAHALEHGSAGMIKSIKETMRSQLPNRLAAKLTDAGIKFDPAKLTGMTDEIVGILGKVPINSLENVLAARVSGKWLPHFMRATTSIAQEGASMGLVMTTMDYVQHKKGVPVMAGDENWSDRFLKHAIFGAVLGGISHAIPGGRGATWGWFRKDGDIWKALGRTNYSLNKMVNKMNGKDTKSFAWETMNSNQAFRPMVNGRTITQSELLNPQTFKSAREIKALKNAIIKSNKGLLRNLRKGVDNTPANIRSELWKDIKNSSPRYITGAYWMSHESIQQYGLGNVIKDPELAFHLWLGAFMTKRGRQVVHGRKQKFLGFDIGDKPYYYHESVNQQVKAMDRAIGNAEHISEITKNFDGRTYAMMQDKEVNPDVDKVLRTLEDHGIIYTEERKNIKKLKTDPDIKDMKVGPVDGFNQFISPLDGIMKIRGFKRNMNASADQQLKALKAIKNTPSDVLSTADNTVNLDNPNVILMSQEMAVHGEWMKIGGESFNVYRDIMRVITGDENFVERDGSSYKYRIMPIENSDGTSALTAGQNTAIGKLHDLRNHLLEHDYLFESKRPLQGSEMFEYGRDWTKEIWDSKLEDIANIQNKWEVTLGGERYGFTSGDPAPHAGPEAWDLWHHIGTAKHILNIRNVYDVLVGKKTSYVGGDAFKWSQIQDGIIKLLRPSEDQTDGRIIVDSPRRLIEGKKGKSQLDPDSVIRAKEQGDYDKLIGFMNALWKVNTIVKKAEGITKDEIINLDEVRALYDKITSSDVGFPKNDFTDLRMDQYLEKMVDWGIRKRLEGVGADRGQTYIIAQGMQTGLFKNVGTEYDSGYGLEAPAEITAGMIRNVYGDLSEAGVKHFMKAWENIRDGLGGKVNFRSDMQMGALTADQINFIYSSEVLLKPRNMHATEEAIKGTLMGFSDAIQEQLVGLRADLTQAASVGVEGTEAINLIKMRMKDKEILLDYINSFDQSYLASVTGKGLHRGAAFLNFINRSGLLEKMGGIVDVETPEQFKTISNEIKTIQKRIAEDFSTTLIEDVSPYLIQSRENAIRERTEEIDGRSGTDGKMYVTPDSYFLEHGVTTTSFTDGRYVPGSSYESHAEVLQTLYDNTIKNRRDFPEQRDALRAFRDELYRVAGFQHPYDIRQVPGVVWRKNGYFQYETPQGIGEVRISDYQSEATAHAAAQGKSRSIWMEATLPPPTARVKDQVMRLFKLHERQSSVKSVSVVGASGNWAEKNISKGPLTDLHNEIFGVSAHDLILFDHDYIDKSNKLRKFDGQGAEGFEGELDRVAEILANPGFRAGQKAGGSKIKRLMAEALHDVNEGVDPLNTPYESKELTRLIEGSHYMVPVDESITMLVSRDMFSPLAERFFEWYTDYRGSDYINSFRANDPNGREMAKIRELDLLYNNLESSRIEPNSAEDRPGVVFAAEIIEGQSGARNAEVLSSAIYKMWDSMYSQKINADWLTAMTERPDHWAKYKRLSQNIGYSRNSGIVRNFMMELWGGDNTYNGRIVRKYSSPDKDILMSFVIDDSNVSVKGQDANGLLTDNRSVAEWNLLSQHTAGRINDIQLSTMQDFYRNQSDFINAEHSNAATIVRRERLNYLLLQDGQSGIIGESAGRKDVGLTSTTDSNGTIHVYTNKTHYFFNSQFDRFFENNPNIDEIAFKSGAKNTSRVVTSPGAVNIQDFRPYGNIPRIQDLEGVYRATENYLGPVPRNFLANWVNGINSADHPEAVMLLDANQMISGVSYGLPREAKVIKQFGNWASEDIQREIFEAYRSDAADRFGAQMSVFTDPMNVRLLVDELRGIMRSRDDLTNAVDVQSDNATTAAMFVEAGGPPLDPLAKSFTENLLKSKYIIDAGVFDGYTTSGGSSVMRNNSDLLLEVPTYIPRGDGSFVQTTIGEGNVGQAYLNRPILFSGDYNINRNLPTGVVPREKLRTHTTQTISFRHNKTDYLIDLKTRNVFDPHSREGDPYIHLKDAPFSDNVKQRIEHLRSILGTDITEWSHLYSEIRNVLNDGLPAGEGFNLIASFQRPPRTGPHDLVLHRVRDSILKEDGGLSEHNPHDVTLKSQADFDTDHGEILLDNPFNVLVHAYRKNGLVMEPRKLETSEKDMYPYNPSDWRSSMMQFGRLRSYGVKRGQIVKNPRKLTHSHILLKSVDGIKIGDNSIVFNETHQGLRGTVTDNQNVLDIYQGFAKNLGNLNQYFENTHFSGDHPFFQIRSRDGGLRNINPKTDALEVSIMNKIMSDFGSLLSLEGKVYEAGESRTPRYTDYVSRKRFYDSEYSTRDNRINFNFYNYLVNRGLRSKADELFYNSDPKKIKAKQINDVMGPVGLALEKNLTSFDKSLDRIASRDRLSMEEITNTEGNDYFSSGINKLASQYRGELLRQFEITGERPKDVDPWSVDSIMNQQWESINEMKNVEKALSQVTILEEQVRRQERFLSDDRRKKSMSESDLEYQTNSLVLKKELMATILNKLSMSPEFNKIYGEQDFITRRKVKARGKKGSEYYPYKARGGEVVRSKSGRFIRSLKEGQVHNLNRGDVVVINPIEIVPVTTGEMVSGLAHAKTVLGLNSRIQEGFKGEEKERFFDLQNRTRGKIKKLTYDFVKRKGFRDWTEHGTKVQAIIDNALKKLLSIANEGVEIDAGLSEGSYITNLPSGKHDYGKVFLLGLLAHGESGNKFHYMKQSNQIVEAIRVPSPTVIRAVFDAIKNYGIVANHRDFVTSYAKELRSWHDLLVQNEGFDRAMDYLQSSTLGSSLMASNVKSAVNSPFLPREEYKSLTERMEMSGEIGSEFAELFIQIIQDRVTVDPKTAMMLRHQFIQEMEAQEPGSGWTKFKNLYQISRGHLVFDGVNTYQTGIGKGGEGMYLGEVVRTDPTLLKNIITGKKRPNKGKSIDDLIDSVTGEANKAPDGGC